MAVTADGGGIDTTVLNVYESVRVLSSRRTVLVRSATNVEDVEEIGAESLPSHIYFLKYVLYTTFQNEGALVPVAVLGFQIESALALPGVLGAIFVQDVDATGLLTNGIEFTVAHVDSVGVVNPDLTTTVTISLMNLEFADNWAQPIFDAQALISGNFP